MVAALLPPAKPGSPLVPLTLPAQPPSEAGPEAGQPKTLLAILARLRQQVRSHYQRGEFEPAIGAAVRLYVTARQHLGVYSPECNHAAWSLELLCSLTAGLHTRVALQMLTTHAALLGDPMQPDQCRPSRALQFFALGEYQRAQDEFRDELRRQEQRLQGHPSHLAAYLEDLAECHAAMARYNEAESFLRRGLAVRRQHAGERHPLTLSCSIRLAGLHRRCGKFADAEALCREVLDLLRPDDSPRPLLADALDLYAALLLATGRYAAAEPPAQQALEIRRTAVGKVSLPTAASLVTLAVLERTRGHYDPSEGLFQQALDIQRAVLDLRTDFHLGHAATLDGLGELYRLRGFADRADPLLRRALAIRQFLAGDDHPDFALTLHRLACLACDRGDYVRAEALQLQSLTIVRAALGPCHPLVAQVLHHLAELYRGLDHDTRAEPLYHEALDLRGRTLGEMHPDHAASLNGLAVLLRERGDAENAEALCRRALAAVGATLPPVHPLLAAILDNLARLELLRGDVAQAEPRLRQALDILTTTLGESHPLTVQTLSGLAMLCRALGRLSEAKPLLVRTLELRKQTLGERHPTVGADLRNLACVCAGDRPAEALDLLQQALAFDDRLIEQTFAIGSGAQHAEVLEVVRENTQNYLALVFQHLAHSAPAIQSAFDLVLRRKAIATEILCAQHRAVLEGWDPLHAALLRELTQLRRQIAEKALAGADRGGLDAHLQTLADWSARREELEARLARRMSADGRAGSLKAVSRWEVAGSLPEGAALVEFVRVAALDFSASAPNGPLSTPPDHYLAFVMPAGCPDDIGLIDLGEAAEIDRLLNDFRAAITGEGDARTLRDLRKCPQSAVRVPAAAPGLALRRSLFDPIVPLLNGHRRLFLAPDGDLTRLPLEVLPTDDGRRLLDDYRVSYLGTGRDLLGLASKPSGAATPPLVVADPNFDLAGRRATPRLPEGVGEPRWHRDLDRLGCRFERLPGTRAEGLSIAALLGVPAWVGPKALETPLKKRRSPSILHLATHGFFLADRPSSCRSPEAASQPDSCGRLAGPGMENPLLRSGLALAGANTWLNRGDLPPEAEDGLLTAEDVLGLNLLDTELVVLSACETGLGEVHNGEGVFGLRRAFVLAGARTLVMSLWKVPDRQTQELMEDFYRRILAGEPRSEALRQAQLGMKARHPDPYFWGAFICQGDPSPLTNMPSV